MGAKIRNAELSKIPVMIILGEKEVESNSISVRRRFVGNQGSVDLDSFIESSVDEIKQRAKSPTPSNG
jgi:threonyl-tRNA synthetase